MNYHLLDLSNLDVSDIGLVDSAYILWEKTYKEIANGEYLNPDSFWRSKILAVIEINGVLVGFHLYNGFNLKCESIHNHSYLKQLTLDQIISIKKKNIYKIMSGEFLTVHPEYRGRKDDGVSWSEVIVGLCTKVFLHSPWDAIVGISRVDKKVDQITKNFGGIENGNVEKYQIPCKVIVAQKSDILPPINTKTNEIIEDLWDSVKNKTSIISSANKNLNRRAA